MLCVARALADDDVGCAKQLDYDKSGAITVDKLVRYFSKVKGREDIDEIELVSGLPERT